MFPAPSAIFLGLIFNLVICIIFFTVTWVTLKISLKVFKLHSNNLFKKFCYILFVSIPIYFLIFGLFIIFGQYFGPSIASEHFLIYGFPVIWLVLAAFMLGQAIYFPNGNVIGKVKASLIFGAAGTVSFSLIWALFASVSKITA
jgi:hypothetical protein